MSTTRTPHHRPRSVTITRFVLLVVAVSALVAGPAHWINGLTQADGDVEVQVRYATTEGLDATSDLDALVGVVGLQLPPVLARGVDDAQPSASLSTANDDLTLSVWDSTLTEQALARGDDLVSAVALGVGALLLWRTVGTLGQGRPFARGNAARVLGVAGAVALDGFVAPLLPQMASGMVLARLGIPPGGALQPTALDPDLAVVVTIALLVVLAEVFRHGERLARETDGLV